MVFYTLTVESPASISGDYRVQPADFGPGWTEGVFTSPVFDCREDFQKPTKRDLYQKIVMIKRSAEKPDYTVAGLLQNKLAAAVLMVMRSQGEPDRLKLPSGTLDDHCKIPVFCIGKADAQSISGALEKGVVVLSLVAEVNDIYSFGLGNSGQLGLSGDHAFVSYDIPQLCCKEKSVKALHCGQSFTLVLLDSGAIFSFGNNEFGQLGLGDRAARSKPEKIEFDDGVKVPNIGGGSEHGLAVTGKKGLYSWGFNSFRQLGHSEDEDSLVPKLVHGFQDKQVLSVDAGYMHTICLVLNYNVTGAERARQKVAKEQLAKKSRMKATISSEEKSHWNTKAIQNPTKKDARLAHQHEQEKQKKLAADPNAEFRTIYTWGDGGKGQMGHGPLYTTAYFHTQNPKDNAAIQARERKFTCNGCPRKIEALLGFKGSKFVAVKARGSQSAILTSAQEVLVFGSNEFGQLGLGHTENSNVPCQIPTKGLQRGESFVDVALGQFHSVFLSSLGNVYACGRGAEGQLGLGPEATKPHHNLVLVPKLSRRGVAKLFAGDKHNFAQTNLGQLYAWGATGTGRLGLGEGQAKTDVEFLYEPEVHQFLEKKGEWDLVALGSAHSVISSMKCPADDVDPNKVALSVMEEKKEELLSPSFFDCCSVS